jgi:hypothetical protein
MHHRVLVRKPLKTAWLNVAMRPQRFDGSTYDAAVGSAARKRERSRRSRDRHRRVVVNVVAGKERSGDQEADQETSPSKAATCWMTKMRGFARPRSFIVTPGAP